MNQADRENARTLAHVLGIDEAEASTVLGQEVLVTAGAEGADLAADIVRILERTVRRVWLEAPPAGVALEVLVGAARPRTPALCLHVSLSPARFYTGTIRPDGAGVDPVPGVLTLIAACYAASAVVHKLVGARFPYPAHDPLEFDPGQLLSDVPEANENVDVGVLHLAGAGAVGGAFLLALARFRVSGTIHIADPDVCEDGNLNRTILFSNADVGKPKAVAAAERASELGLGAQLLPHPGRLQELAVCGPWLERLVSTVDSRRARRLLQEELPREVYDASTSGIAEVVLHVGSTDPRRPCLGCIYHEDRRENAHEEHVAAMLGIAVQDVRENFLSERAAQDVLRRHPGLAGRKLAGIACDTLFKELCATGSLGIDSGQQVLAPLALVSVLAGALLALEVVLRVRNPGGRSFNAWRVSPWSPPRFDGQRTHFKRDGCTVCGRAEFAVAVREIWKGRDESADVDGKNESASPTAGHRHSS
jgi:molybdopterin/thiamine biosynthesis adenylyltransferase